MKINQNKSRNLIRILIFAIAVSFLLPSCNTGTDNTLETESNETTALTGVYTKTTVPLDENFAGAQAMDSYRETIYMIGTMKDGDNYIQTMAAVNSADLSVTYEPIPAEESFNSISVSSFGYLLMAVSFDQNTFEQTYTLYCVKDGDVFWEEPVSGFITLPESFRGNIYIASDENRWYVGGDNTLAVLSPDGTLEKSETLPGSIEGIYRDINGIIHITGNSFHYTNDENGNIASNTVWQQALNAAAVKSGIYFGSGYDFYYGTENALYGYDIESGTPTELMNWVNSGLVPTGQMKLTIISPETIFYEGNDGIGGKQGLWKYTKADDKILSDKTIICITYMEDGRNQIPTAAVKFNAAQSVYHVVCEEYSSSHSGGDYTALLDGLDAAILSGSVGDIVQLDSMDSIVKYSSKNLFADLYTLMNDEFSADDIFGCVRETCGIGGKLYGIPQEFILTTYAAKTQNLNQFDLWDTGAFIELSESLPEDQRILFNMSRGVVYNTLRDSAITECMDFDSNTCSFTSGTFTKFLEYLAGLPETDNAGLEYGKNYYVNDEVILYEARVGAYSEYAQMMHLFGENTDVTVVGYPSSIGSAAKLNVTKYYSITESGTVKEGAMVFLRYLLSAECVINGARGMRTIPAFKTTMQAWNESESKMYYYFYTDNIGRTGADTKPITEEDMGSPGLCVAIDQKLIDETYAFLDSVRICPPVPQSVIDLVEEEMSAYLSSDKTADETAKIIQNRVSIYLSEQK